LLAAHRLHLRTHKLDPQEPTHQLLRKCRELRLILANAVPPDRVSPTELEEALPRVPPDGAAPITCVQWWEANWPTAVLCAHRTAGRLSLADLAACKDDLWPAAAVLPPPSVERLGRLLVAVGQGIEAELGPEAAALVSSHWKTKIAQACEPVRALALAAELIAVISRFHLNGAAPPAGAKATASA
jgi:hypothetical protein